MKSGKPDLTQYPPRFSFQTLSFTPLRAHANRTLRCLVDHPGFDSEDDRQAEVVVRLVGGGGSADEEGEEEEQDG